MRRFGIVAVFILVATSAVAQSEPSLSTMAPVLGEIGLAVLAIGIGLGGAYGIHKYRGK